MAKRMKLISEETYNLLMSQRSEPFPEKTFVNKDDLAKKLLQSEDIPDDIKLAMYMSIIRDFTNKVEELAHKPESGQSLSDADKARKPFHENLSEVDEPAEESDRDLKLVSIFPEKIRSSVEVILERIKNNRDLIFWNNKGEVTFFLNEFVEGSSIIDLINYILRDLKWKVAPKGANRFILVCRKLNVPASIVRKSLRESFSSSIPTINAVKSASESFHDFSGYQAALIGWTNLDDEDEDTFLDTQTSPKKST